MKRIMSVLALSAVVVGSLAAAGQSAHASERSEYEITISNPTGTTIRFEIKWGAEGEWESCSLPPGKKWELGSDNGEPTIRFNAGYVAGKMVSKSYNLGNEASYVFRFSRDGRSLDLYLDKTLVETQLPPSAFPPAPAPSTRDPESLPPDAVILPAAPSTQPRPQQKVTPQGNFGPVLPYMTPEQARAR